MEPPPPNEEEGMASNESDETSDAKKDTPGSSAHSGVRRLHSAQSSGMESSVFKFKKVNSTVGM